MPKCDFNKVAGCSPVNLLHIFRTPFRKNTASEWVFVLLDPRSSALISVLDPRPLGAWPPKYCKNKFMNTR